RASAHTCKRRSYVAGSVHEPLAALSVSASVGTASSFAVRDVARPQKSPEAPAQRALRAPDRGGPRIAGRHHPRLLRRTSKLVLRGPRGGRVLRNFIFEVKFL